MSTHDPISDLLTCIRNAQMMGIIKIRVPHSIIKESIVLILEKEGYVAAYELLSEGVKKELLITLKYYEKRPVIEKIKRISRPSLRVYRKYHQLPVVRGGMGIAIISTPQGLITDKEARQRRIGGEVLCTVE